MNKFYKTKFWRLLNRTHEIEESVSSALDSAQKPGSKVSESAVGASALSKKGVEGDGGILCGTECDCSGTNAQKSWQSKRKSAS